MTQTLSIAQSAIAGTAAPMRPRAVTAADAGFTVHWARHEDEVREAQRLRWRVFVDEMGARPVVMAGVPPLHDVDRYDPWCEHLLVRIADGPMRGLLVGTYRVLGADAARCAGGFYSETEFELEALLASCVKPVELGRSCVHPEWRSGAVILALWSALFEFMAQQRVDTLFGCASIGMSDGGHQAASLWHGLAATHAASPQHGVRPRLPLPVEALRCDLKVEPPPLIKGYLRCGGKVLGPPAWDPSFNTADLPMMLRMDELHPRYRRHFVDARARS